MAVVNKVCKKSKDIITASVWLDAVHPWLKDVHQASVWFNAVYQASMWLNMAQCMLCIHGSMMCIWHQYGLMLCIRHHYGTIWLNAVQASIDGLMLCIRLHNYDPWLIHDSNCASCINMAQCSTKLCPLPFLLLRLRLTLEQSSKKRGKVRRSQWNVMSM